MTKFVVRCVHHQLSYSPDEIIINPSKFPGVKVGDILQIHGIEDAVAPSKSNSTQLSKLPKPAKMTREEALFLAVKSLKSAGNLEISILNTIADEFSLPNRTMVHVEVASAKTAALDFLELSFRNQYIGRADMWRIKDCLEDTCVYRNNILNVEGMQMKIEQLSKGKKDAEQVNPKSGLVTEHTKITFRSTSARLFFLIHLSSEMWEFAEDGELYFEKVNAITFPREHDHVHPATLSIPKAFRTSQNVKRNVITLSPLSLLSPATSYAAQTS